MKYFIYHFTKYTLLLLGAANFEPPPCIPVESLVRFLAPAVCALISDKGDVPVESRKFQIVKITWFLNSG